MSTTHRMLSDRPMRVLHFVAGGFSGATQVAIDLCAGAGAEQETLLVLRRRGMDPRPHMRELRARGLDVRLVPRWSRAVTILHLARICRRWKPDVLVAHGYSEHLWGRYAGRLARVPHLVHVEHNTHESYTLRRVRQSLRLARHTDRIACVSEAVRDAVVALGHPPALCRVILNGIDLERWSGGLPWHERESALVMPARFGSQKDHATLLHALALLAEQGWRPTLYLAGEGGGQDAMRALARQLGLAQQVRFLGYVSNLHELCGRVKFCVLSTHYEGLGLGLVEGMAIGCCGIGTDVPGVSEVLEDGKTGVLVPPADPRKLSWRIRQLLEDDERASQLAQSGRERVHRVFDKRRMQADYLAMFREMRDRS